MTFSEELQWRGFVNQTTLDDPKRLNDEKFTFYLGVDPSADSMQVGNLAVMMLIRHFIAAGHKSFLLVGGATGMIGDPGGKNEERNLQTLETIEHNKEGIKKQFHQVLNGQDFTVVDNYDWFKEINVLSFLRDVGKHFSMTQLVDRDFIATRMGEGGSGISFAEFSYTLLQGYDYLHLHKEYGVNLQLCGSDQWGNSLSGVDLIRKVTGDQAHIWSAPLVINKATGQKFGKSEGGAIWLDPAKTSVFSFYQFWLNVDDQGVKDYLKIYTLITPDEFESLIDEFEKNPQQRAAQKHLAFETTKIVHGEERAKSVKRLSEVLFGTRDYQELQPEDFAELSQELGTTTVAGDEAIEDVLVQAKLASSKSEARRFVESNAVYINGKQIIDRSSLSDEDSIQGFIVIRRGKNATAILAVQK